MDCLGNDTLVDYVSDALPPGDRSAVEAHLDGCPKCLKLVAGYLATSKPPPQEGGEQGAARTEPAVQSDRSRGPRLQPPWSGEGATLRRGAQVGRYLVLDELGAGGMGVVLAAYDPELDRKVALKLMHPSLGAAHPEARARMVREAQAMARIAHPNVVAVHDVGTLDEQVFIAMELVPSVSVGAWLAERRDWHEVLRVFAQAGAGLAAAHAAGVVHRDFKPENVLLGHDGRVRVTDFGLAASRWGAEPDAGPTPAPAATADEVATVLVTHTGVVVGTPAYLAPERFEGKDADAASDQFSFCASLYRALWGQAPFEGKTLEALRRAVTAGAPREPPPGDVPPAVRRAVLRGLSAKPEARFESIDALLRALAVDGAQRRGRWLAGAAVLAVAAAAGATAWSSRVIPCQGAAGRLAAIWEPQRRAAITQAFLATGLPYARDAVNGFTATVDAQGQRWVAMHTEACEATRVHGSQTEQVLDLRMLCLEQRLKELDALARRAVSPDPRFVENAVSIAHGLAPVEECADLARLTTRQRPPRDEAARKKLDAVQAGLAEAEAAFKAGRVPESEALATAAAAASEAVDYAPARAEALRLVANAQHELGKKEARATYLKALHAAEAGADPAAIAELWLHLMVVDSTAARFDDALADDEHARAVITGLGGDDRLELNRLDDLAGLQRAMGKGAEAQQSNELALERRRARYGPDSLQTSLSEYNLAIALIERGRIDEALPHIDTALAVRTRELGPAHPRVAMALNVKASALKSQGKAAEALALFTRALAIQEQVAKESPDVAGVLRNLANVEEDLGQLELARQHVTRATEIYVKTLGPENPRTLNAQASVCTVLNLSGDLAGALACDQQVLKAREKVLGPKHPHTLMSLNNLGESLMQQGHFKEARGYLERAAAAAPDSAELRAVLEHNLGKCELGEGRLPEAEARFTRARALHLQVGGPDSPKAAESAAVLAEVLRRRGRLAEAKALAAAAVTSLEKTGGDADPRLVAALTTLGAVGLDERSALPEARAALERAAALGAKDADPRLLVLTRVQLARALLDQGADKARVRTLLAAARATATAAPGFDYELAELARLERRLGR